jgi:hypothetical protein
MPRRPRNWRNYVTAAEAAKFLRDSADTIERSPPNELVMVDMSIWFWRPTAKQLEKCLQEL